MKVLIKIALLIFWVNNSFSQHCSYDHSALIGVRPVDANNQIINGLRITMVNQKGEPIMVRKSIFKRDKYISSYQDTAEFWRNPPPNKYVNHNIREEEKRHFIQASTDYIIITNNKGREEKGRYVKIEDIDAEANGGFFSAKIVYIKAEHIQGLCGYPNGREFEKNYLPFIVKLDKYIDRKQFITKKELNGYQFIFDKSPLAPCPECEGCYCQLFMVFAPDSTVLFNQLFTFQEQEDKIIQKIDSFQVGDYNFDGVPDFRFFNGFLKYQEVYLFRKERKKYEREPLLSRMLGLYFDEKNKILNGVIVDSKAHAQPNKIMKNLGSYDNLYQMQGENLTDVRIISSYFFNPWNGYYIQPNDSFGNGRDRKDTAYYEYRNYELVKKEPVKIQKVQRKVLEDDSSHNLYIKSLPPFKFVLEKNCQEVELPAEKGYYANKISVYDLKNNQLIYTTVAVGNQLKEAPGCSDSLQIADYNFDGFPDFRICNNSVAGKHIYYINHKKRNTFIIEKTLTELHGLTFDFEQKIAKGNTERKEYMGYPWESPYQYYMETLQFEGRALENLKVTTTTYGSGTAVTAIAKYVNQKRMYEGDSLAIKIQKNNWLIKTVGPFKFEVEFNPEEYKPSGEKGSYVKILNIYQKERRVGHFEMHGNYLKEVSHWLDSLEIADYNFDGFPDIRMYNSHFHNGRHVYFLYNPEPDVKQFYQDTYFSLLLESEFIPKEKIMKGKILEANQTIYFFLKNDTLTLTTQDKDLSKSPFIEESIYKNGNRKGLRSAYGKLEPEIKKEYGDYNFDGYDDFRQQSKKNPYYYDVFIYNSKTEAFEKDTLLSKFEVFNFNKQDKKLEGSFRIRPNETTWLTKYYQWSFTEKKMMLYQEQTCYSKYPMSESQRCIISKLVDGKWIETKTFGAE